MATVPLGGGVVFLAGAGLGGEVIKLKELKCVPFGKTCSL